MNYDSLDTFPQSFLACYHRGHPRQEYSVPRWSKIAGCARSQYYAITGAHETNPSDGRSDWVANKGHLTQLEVLRTLEAMGHNIVTWEGREGDDNTADWYDYRSPEPMITGHIDAEVEWYDRRDLGITVLDCKDRNLFSYLRWATEDLVSHDPEAYFQMQGYLQCRNRVWGAFVVTAQDSASTKSEIRKRRNLLIAPHPVLFRFFIPRYKPAFDLMVERAKELMFFKATETLPAREFKVGHDWHCDYCDYRIRCEADGPEGEPIPHWTDMEWLIIPK